MEEEHAERVVTAPVQPEEVDQGVLLVSESASLPPTRSCSKPQLSPERHTVTHDRRCKRPVQPPSPLTDQLRRLLRHVRFGLARLDVGQDPFVAGLGDELKAEYSACQPVPPASRSSTYRSSARNMFLVKMFMPWMPFLPSRAATAPSALVQPASGRAIGKEAHWYDPRGSTAPRACPGWL